MYLRRNGARRRPGLFHPGNRKLYRNFLESCQRLINDKGIDNLKVAEKMSGMVVEMETLLFELQRPGYDLRHDNARSKQIALLMDLCKDLEGNLKEKRNDLHAK